jgi:hypothetical protein
LERFDRAIQFVALCDEEGDDVVNRHRAILSCEQRQRNPYAPHRTSRSGSDRNNKELDRSGSRMREYHNPLKTDASGSQPKVRPSIERVRKLTAQAPGAPFWASATGRRTSGEVAFPVYWPFPASPCRRS